MKNRGAALALVVLVLLIVGANARSWKLPHWLLPPQSHLHPPNPFGPPELLVICIIIAGALGGVFWVIGWANNRRSR